MLDWLACSFVRVFGWIVCRLPLGFSVRVGAAAGWIVSWLAPSRIRIGCWNIKAALGDRLAPGEPKRIVRKLFMNLGAGFVEMLRLPAMDMAYAMRYLTVSGQEHFDRFITTRPMILLSGHFGNWELCSIAATYIKGHPLTAVARMQDKFPKLYELLVSYREAKGCTVVHKGNATRQVLKALDALQPVAIVADQASRKGIFVNFLGRPALFATGPFELARMRNAVLLFVFTHRIRGAYHRLVVEPPVELPSGDPEAAIRYGVEQFAAALEKHILEDPSQWLWLHKRWKFTTATRVLVLSDGKLGHVKQSLAVVQALKEHSDGIQDRLLEVRYRSRFGRALAVAYAALPWIPGRWCALRLALEPACYAALANAYANIVVSCGASTAPVNALVSRDTRAKSVVIMNPSPLPVSRFTLAFVPMHDRPKPGRNVVPTMGALSVAPNGPLPAAGERLQGHPRFRAVGAAGPEIAVFVGGDTPDYQVTAAFVEQVMGQVLGVCEELDGACLVTTSRRTAPAVEQWLSARLGEHPRCRLLLLASRDQLDGTLHGMVGRAKAIVVTADSVSMVSEACASGRTVFVVEPPLKPGASRATKARRYLEALAREQYVHRPSLADAGQAIRRVLQDRRAPRRLETYAAVRDAVKRLL